MKKFLETKDITDLLRNINRDVDFDITYINLNDIMIDDFTKYFGVKTIDNKMILPSINKQIDKQIDKHLNGNNSVGLIIIPSYDKFIKYAIEFVNE